VQAAEPAARATTTNAPADRRSRLDNVLVPPSRHRTEPVVFPRPITASQTHWTGCECLGKRTSLVAVHPP
jgi:hypothetical protein